MGTIIEEPVVLSIDGHMGAGKTNFIQGIAKGLDVKERVVSPTYMIICEYEGRLPFIHADLYRIDNVDHIEALGLEEYFYDNHVCAVEWAYKAKELLPPSYLSIRIGQGNENDPCARIITINSVGKRHEKYLRRLSQAKIGD